MRGAAVRVGGGWGKKPAKGGGGSITFHIFISMLRNFRFAIRQTIPADQPALGRLPATRLLVDLGYFYLCNQVPGAEGHGRVASRFLWHRKRNSNRSYRLCPGRTHACDMVFYVSPAYSVLSKCLETPRTVSTQAKRLQQHLPNQFDKEPATMHPVECVFARTAWVKKRLAGGRFICVQRADLGRAFSANMSENCVCAVCKWWNRERRVDL